MNPPLKPSLAVVVFVVEPELVVFVFFLHDTIVKIIKLARMVFEYFMVSPIYLYDFSFVWINFHSINTGSNYTQFSFANVYCVFAGIGFYKIG